MTFAETPVFQPLADSESRSLNPVFIQFSQEENGFAIGFLVDVQSGMLSGDAPSLNPPSGGSLHIPEPGMKSRQVKTINHARYG